QCQHVADVRRAGTDVPVDEGIGGGQQVVAADQVGRKLGRGGGGGVHVAGWGEGVHGGRDSSSRLGVGASSAGTPRGATHRAGGRTQPCATTRGIENRAVS